MTEQLPDTPSDPQNDHPSRPAPRPHDDEAAAARPGRPFTRPAAPRKGSWNRPRHTPGTAQGQPVRRHDDDGTDRPRFRRDDDGARPRFRRDDDGNDRPRFRRDDDGTDRPRFRRDDDGNDRPRFRRDDDGNDRPRFRRDDDGERPRFRREDGERPRFRREDGERSEQGREEGMPPRRPRPVYDAWNPRPQPVEPEAPAVPYARKRRITIFGGSFDPIHKGHIALASKIIEKELTDEIIFIPTRLQPLKPDGAVATAEQRLEMLSLAITGHKAFAYSDIELCRENGPSYTYDTANLIACAYPDCEVSILIGMDSFCTLSQWHRATELISHFKFLIYPRPGCQRPNLPDIEELCGMRNAVKLFNSILPEGEFDLFNVSATQIRDLLAHHRRIDALVPPAVERYIIDNHLYQP
ncbi:MAG: nicotinate (nicotinamide) nucleotide adenylyltransferase [Oligosphaeraceae bacterium]